MSGCKPVWERMDEEGWERLALRERDLGQKGPDGQNLLMECLARGYAWAAFRAGPAEAGYLDPSGAGPLHCAAAHCPGEAIEALLSAGALAGPDSRGMDPLMIACGMGNWSAARVLLGHCSALASNAHGQDALMMAVGGALAHWDRAFLEDLAMASRPGARDKRMRTALDMAVSSGLGELAEILKGAELRRAAQREKELVRAAAGAGEAGKRGKPRLGL